MGVRMITVQHIRRCNVGERRVLTMLRGAMPDGGDNGDAPLLDVFMHLRQAAQQRELDIKEIACILVSPDEMMLLQWIGESQRCRHALHQHPDGALMDQVTRCGAALTRAGIRLPSATVSAGRT